MKAETGMINIGESILPLMVLFSNLIHWRPEYLKTRRGPTSTLLHGKIETHSYKDSFHLPAVITDIPKFASPRK